MADPNKVKAGRLGGLTNKKNGTGICDPEINRLGREKACEVRRSGIGNMPRSHHVGCGRKAAVTNRRNKTSIFDPAIQGKASRQVWQSLEDGYIGNPGNVARHNKAIGGDPDARIRIE